MIKRFLFWGSVYYCAFFVFGAHSNNFTKFKNYLMQKKFGFFATKANAKSSAYAAQQNTKQLPLAKDFQKIKSEKQKPYVYISNKVERDAIESNILKIKKKTPEEKIDEIQKDLKDYNARLDQMYTLHQLMARQKDFVIPDNIAEFPGSYRVPTVNGIVMYINNYILYDDWRQKNGGHDGTSKYYARKIYNLQQASLDTDFTNHTYFKLTVYNRLVRGLAVLYGHTKGQQIGQKNNPLPFNEKVARADNEREIINMIKDQLKNYEEYVKWCTCDSSLVSIDSATIIYQGKYHPKSKELLLAIKTGFVNGYYNSDNNYFAAIYYLYCNEYIARSMNTISRLDRLYPFLLLKCYYDALKNNSLPIDSPYSIKKLAEDILIKQIKLKYPLIIRK